MGDSKKWVLTHVSIDEFMREEAWPNLHESVQDPYPAPLHDSRTNACLHRIIGLRRGRKREEYLKEDYPYPLEINTVLAGVVLTPSDALPQTLLLTNGWMEKEDIHNAEPLLTWSELTFALGEQPQLPLAEEHHFLPVADVTQIRISTVLKAVVGLLNSGRRGAAYLGVGREGWVEGIICSDHLIPIFAMGLLNALRDCILPRPICGVRGHRTLDAGRVTNAWVVEIKTSPRVNVYYSAVALPDYYHHHQGMVHSLPFTLFCQEVIGRTALPYQQKLERLREDIKRIKELLEEQHEDIVMGPHVCPSFWYTDCPTAEHGQSQTTGCCGGPAGHSLTSV